MIWEELVKIALIGTDRAAIPAHLIKKIMDLGLDPNLTPEQLLLELAAWQAPRQKAGWQPPAFTGRVPPLTEPETGTICSPVSNRHLQKILSGEFALALPEFLREVEKNQKRLPPEHLPELIAQGKADAELWKQIEPLLGPRGKWLLRMNPLWSELSDNMPSIEWDSASSEQRLKLLRALRRQDPQQALVLVRSTWREDDLRSRIGILQNLSIGLSPDDEGFLESCLDDKRKEIRLHAAALLSAVESSAYVGRMFERAVASFRIKKKKKEKLSVNLPNSLDPSALRDGLGARTDNRPGGLKAGWLGQMMEAVPPGRWERHFDKTADEVFELFIRSDWAPTILQALVRAAQRYKNEKWIALLLRFWLNRGEQSRWQDFNGYPLLQLLTPKLFNQAAIAAFDAHPALPEEKAPLMELLKAGNFAWEDKLLAQWLRALQDWLSSAQSGYWEGFQYRIILQKAAYYCHPSHAKTIKRSFSAADRRWSGWEKQINQFVEILEFRNEMIKELAK